MLSSPRPTGPGPACIRGGIPQLIDQGEADRYAQWFYDHLDPITHLGAYERPVAISFHCASEDRHVPSDGAKCFRSALVERDPSAVDRVRVTTYQGLSHLDGARDDCCTTTRSSGWLRPLEALCPPLGWLFKDRTWTTSDPAWQAS